MFENSKEDSSLSIDEENGFQARMSFGKEPTAGLGWSSLFEHFPGKITAS